MQGLLRSRIERFSHQRIAQSTSYQVLSRRLWAPPWEVLLDFNGYSLQFATGPSSPVQ